MFRIISISLMMRISAIDVRYCAFTMQENGVITGARTKLASWKPGTQGLTRGRDGMTFKG